MHSLTESRLVSLPHRAAMPKPLLGLVPMPPLGRLLALATMLQAHGADIVDVSTGQTSVEAKPAYGRLYQTPFADRIRQETGVPTITVGAVASVEDANTIIASGRADLCAIARPHLVDPYWTMNAALDQDYRGHPLPKQYRTGLSARRRTQTP